MAKKPNNLRSVCDHATKVLRQTIADIGAIRNGIGTADRFHIVRRALWAVDEQLRPFEQQADEAEHRLIKDRLANLRHETPGGRTEGSVRPPEGRNPAGTDVGDGHGSQ